MRKVILTFAIMALSVFSIPTLALCDLTCAKVGIEILQKLTMERVAFDANLKITNGLAAVPLENVSVVISITDTTGADQSALFFVRPPDCAPTGFNVSGTGTALPSSVSTAHWLIIPSPGAGGETADGKTYFVGATMSYTVEGEVINLPIYPCSIPGFETTAKPQRCNSERNEFVFDVAPDPFGSAQGRLDPGSRNFALPGFPPSRE